MTLRLERVAHDGWTEYRLVLDGRGVSQLAAALEEVLRDMAKVVPSDFAATGVPDAVGVADRTATRLARLLAALAAVDVTRHQLQCGFATIGFAADSPVHDYASLLGPYYAIENATDAISREVVGISEPAVYHEAADLWAELDYLLWHRVAGSPDVATRGEGFLFFRDARLGTLGRFRFPSLVDAAPVYYVQPHERGCWYVIHDRASAEGALAPARALRAISSHRALREGGWPIHASAFATADGRAYLICGDRHTGKTTSLISAITYVPGARLLSNDRVILAPDGAGMRAYGYPHSIGLRHGTLTLDERFRALLGDGDRWRQFSGSRRGYSYSFTASGPPASTAPSVSEASLFLEPAELARFLGTECARDGVLAGIIIASFDPRATQPTWEQLAGDTAPAVIDRYRHAYYDNAQPFWNDLLPLVGGRSPAPMDLRDVRLWRLTANGELRRAWEQFVTLAAIDPPS